MYKIITARSANELEEKVIKASEEGYVPQGSHQVVVKFTQNRFNGSQHMSSTNECEYSQTMIKTSEPSFIGKINKS